MTPHPIIQTTTLAIHCLFLMSTATLPGTEIPISDPHVQSGLSPYNWVSKDGALITTVNGASLIVKFKGTSEVVLKVATDHIKAKAASRFPILAWSVNGGAPQTHQLAANESSVPLSSGIADPTIDLYVKGTSPFEGRFTGDVPENSVKITGFNVTGKGATVTLKLPDKVWLNLGDSIMSGDGAAYAKGQGRPPDDAWAASEDGRASYGYLLANHFGYREARIAYGGYNWGGGMAQVPALTTLIDQRTSTVSRLEGGFLSPIPDLVMINLGENGAPADASVIQALTKVRSRVKPMTKIIVMIPASGRGKGEISRAFNSYKTSSSDKNTFLIDLGPVAFDTCDGQHPTAAGHQAIYKTALPAFEAILTGKNK
jgi:hypothetical protein